jgi:hypothetical protein
VEASRYISILPPVISACNPRFFYEEKSMKNLKSCLFVVVLVSFVYVLTPGNALAQDDGLPPCCYDALSTTAILANSGMQSQASLSVNTHKIMESIHPQLSDIQETMPVLDRMALLRITGREIRMSAIEKKSWGLMTNARQS